LLGIVRKTYIIDSSRFPITFGFETIAVIPHLAGRFRNHIVKRRD